MPAIIEDKEIEPVKLGGHYYLSPELCYGDVLILGPAGFQAVAPWLSADSLTALIARLNAEHMNAEQARSAIEEALNG